MAESQKKKFEKKYGAPPKFKSAAEMQQMIDEYFDECDGELLLNDDGKPVMDKAGHPIYVGKRPPTVTGLALALGFATRTALRRYQAKNPQFTEVLLKARTRVEKYTEERLFDRDGSNGARFSLQFNFEGWKEEKDDEHKGPVITIINDIPRTAADAPRIAPEAAESAPALPEAKKEGGADGGK